MSKGPDFNELARLSRLHNSGGDASASSGSASSGGGGGGDDTKMFRLGANSDAVASVNAAAQSGGFSAMASVLHIKGVPEACQSFALEATMRGMSLQGITSTLSLATPRKVLNGRST